MHAIKKISDEEIIRLIQRTQFIKHLVNNKNIKLYEDSSLEKESSFFSWKKKLMIPIAFLVFSLSALYLYDVYEKAHSPLLHLDIKHNLSYKKQLYLKSAPPTFQELAFTLKELSRTRIDSLAKASKELHYLLTENDNGTLPEFEEKFSLAALNYVNSEKEQQTFITKELDELYDKTHPTTYKQVELFRLLVSEYKLQEYMSITLLQKMKTPMPLSKEEIPFDPSTLHQKLLSSIYTQVN